jgi:hypothetical protein
MEIASQRTKEEKTSQDHVDEEVGVIVYSQPWGTLVGFAWHSGVLCCVSFHINQAVLELDMRYRLTSN